MMATDGLPTPAPSPPAPAHQGHQPRIAVAEPGTGIAIERGVCFAGFAYDVGLGVDLTVAERRIATATQREPIRPKSRVPAYFAFQTPPLRVTQPSKAIALGRYSTAAAVDCVIYDFGAVLVTYSIPLAGPLADLLELSNDLYANAALLADSRRRVEALVATIRRAVRLPNISPFVEDYSIYQIEQWHSGPSGGSGGGGASGGGGGGRPADLLASNAALIARILRSERAVLSDQEVQDALASVISYGPDDATVIDWNAAMFLGPDADDVRAVIEFANVELLELRFMDDRLDSTLDKSYEALHRTRRWWWPRPLSGWGGSGGGLQLHRIARMQVDSALLFEGVNNALKLVGDQFLARVYRLCAARLHLPEWDASILRKLSTVESIYQKMSDFQTTRRMEILEWIVIILIAFEIAMSFVRR